MMLLSLVISVPLPQATPTAEALGCSEVKATAYDVVGDLDTSLNVSSTQWVAQSFQVSSPLVLSRVSLFLATLANPRGPNPLTVQLRANDPSVPGGQPGALLASDSRTYTGESLAFRDFSFGPVPLLANTPYYLVASTSSGPIQGEYLWAVDRTGPSYAQGQGFHSATHRASWIPRSDYDFLFQVWAQNCPPPPPPTPANKDQCKDGGYRNFIDPRTGRPFANQGQCVSFTNR
jgi:hypothetical protein